MSADTTTIPIQDLAKEWLRLDKNAGTHAAIQTLVDQGDDAQLETLLRKRIVFGTAGLRARMEAGYARMNDLTVIQASQGLCAYLLANVPGTAERGVVIGFDHRHHSRRFARLTAAAFLHHKVHVYLYPDLVHTPMVPYGVKRLGAAGGVMITASHNPKDDNGYKVYWGNACQIIPPHDAGIAAAILENLEPQTWDETLVDTSDLVTDPTEAMTKGYFEELSKLSYHRNTNKQTRSAFVYTAMHGVGTPFAQKAFEAFNLPPLHLVGAQTSPDPDFPTVAFPNPEEKGALDMAIAAGEQVAKEHVGVPVTILANDPDADRFAAAERQSSGEWKVFTGNQLGVILGYSLVEDLRSSGQGEEKIAVLASAVSSKMLDAIAKADGFHYEERLTGFKWLGNGAIELRTKGYNVPFAYEEAIGFMCGDVVPDKDGVTALARFAELSARLAAAMQPRTVWEYFNDLSRRFGYFVTGNSYFICRDPALTEAIFRRIRYGEGGKEGEFNFPTTIAGSKVTYVRDLTMGYDSATADHQPTLPVSPGNGQMISFRLENGAAITLRTSGTEPKIKYYIECSGKDEGAAVEALKEVSSKALDELIEPKKHGFQ